MEAKGYIHLYTGNGKGKTSAAIGLVIRAIGAGKRVFIGQFVKGMPYSELNVLKHFPELEIKQYGLDCFIQNNPTQRDIEAACDGIKDVEKQIEAGYYDVIILDEVCIALYYKLFKSENLISILQKKAVSTEVVLTGRYAPAELIEVADLVTEMKEIKHYYNQGVPAREGIEF